MSHKYSPCRQSRKKQDRKRTNGKYELASTVIDMTMSTSDHQFLIQPEVGVVKGSTSLPTTTSVVQNNNDSLPGGYSKPDTATVVESSRTQPPDNCKSGELPVKQDGDIDDPSSSTDSILNLRCAVDRWLENRCGVPSAPYGTPTTSAVNVDWDLQTPILLAHQPHETSNCNGVRETVV